MPGLISKESIDEVAEKTDILLNSAAQTGGAAVLFTMKKLLRSVFLRIKNFTIALAAEFLETSLIL